MRDVTSALLRRLIMPSAPIFGTCVSNCLPANLLIPTDRPSDGVRVATNEHRTFGPLAWSPDCDLLRIGQAVLDGEEHVAARYLSEQRMAPLTRRDR